VTPLTPGDPATRGVAKILGAYRAVMLANEFGMEHDIDIEFLHDFRVATRRSRSVFVRLKSLFPAAVQRRFKQEFCWLNRATGRHRDLDVFLLKLDEYERMLGGRAASALAPLRDRLMQERRKEHAKLVRMLETKRYRRFREDWGETLERLGRQEPHRAAGAPTVQEAANRAIWRMYRRVAKQCPAIVGIEHMEPIHELRKDCKRLRYLIEAFQTIYPARRLKRAVGELKALQEALGELCDTRVQSSLLTEWGNRVGPSDGGDGELQRTLDDLKHTINQRGHRLFAELGVQLERFNGASNRKLYQRVFRPLRS
jgi:CHAD domain-containing protein